MHYYSKLTHLSPQTNPLSYHIFNDLFSNSSSLSLLNWLTSTTTTNETKSQDFKMTYIHKTHPTVTVHPYYSSSWPASNFPTVYLSRKHKQISLPPPPYHYHLPNVKLRIPQRKTTKPLVHKAVHHEWLYHSTLDHSTRINTITPHHKKYTLVKPEQNLAAKVFTHVIIFPYISSANLYACFVS